MHSTNDLNDGYIGSGKRLWYSINKYGKDKHTCEILEFLPDRKTLKEKEAVYINNILNEVSCMNIVKGGSGGFEHINNNKDYDYLHTKNGKKSGMIHKNRMEMDVKYNIQWRKKVSNSMKRFWKFNSCPPSNGFMGKQHSIETKKKMSNIKRGKGLLGTNSNAKTVIDNKGNVFSSLLECAHFYNISSSTVSRRIQSGVFKFKQ